MILIEITGQTFPWREKYKSLGFRWRPSDKTWWKLETEASLQNTMEGLRNQYVGQKVEIILRSADVDGNILCEQALIVERLAIATAERETVDWLKCFHAITNGYEKSAVSPAKERKARQVDDAFF